MGIDILTLAAARAGKGSGGSASKYKQPDWGSEVTEVEILPQTSFGADQLTPVGWRITTPIVQSLELGKEYDVIYNGKKYTCASKESAILDGSPQVALGNLSQVNGNDTGEPFMFVEFLEKTGGVSAMLLPLDGSTNATISIKAVEETIHKLPSKYVEGVGKYKQPEWGAGTAIVDILPEATYELTEESEGMCPIMTPFVVTVGKEYTVNYNGTEYVCSPIGDDGEIYLGNVGAAGMPDAEDTGEPFVIGVFNEVTAPEMGFYGMVIPLDGSTSCTLSIKGEGEVIHTIPTKYTGSTMRVTVTHDKTADKTYEEIETAIENGVIVQVFFDAIGNLSENGYTVYTLSQFIKGAGIFFYNGGLRQILTIASDGTIDVGMAD